ncbi:hypothetical protein KUTeg_014640 [Tegillarca granosa]|uniref:Uncharacterized protein n=1 Tax=Tegillarca granosa TaxID=220873 RepID=A0ABQ9EVQ8_TEGGR|nr:hypothetical protein KUTeg_014640 [Tegillarca granosa]
MIYFRKWKEKYLLEQSLDCIILTTNKWYKLLQYLKVSIYELTHDNLTEHPSTMNVLERMNIYQEVILSIIYRILPIKVYYA